MNLKHRSYRLLVNLKQRTCRLLSVLIVSLAAAFGLNASVNADTWYVDGSLTPCGIGTSWGTAFRYLQDALNEPGLAVGDEIWVRAGEYFVDQDCANPGGTGLRTATFNLVEGVDIYGGFEGIETMLIERDPLNNVTTLSGVVLPPDPSDPPAACTDPDPGAGDCFTPTPGIEGCTNLACCDVVCDIDPICCVFPWDQACVDIAIASCHFDAYHVVTAGSGITTSTILDGFTITGGDAIGGSGVQDHGGGMYISASEPSVVRCIFIANEATRGGGVFVQGDPVGGVTPLFYDCLFIDNTALGWGGGLANFQGANPLLVNALFTGNSALGNDDVDGGGGVWAGGNPVGSHPELVNCTLGDNSAPSSDGGGIASLEGGGGSDVTLTNSVLWGNTDSGPTDESAQIFSNTSGTDVVNYCCIQGLTGGLGGVGNIGDDPLFIDAGNSDYRLNSTSPCIDVGDLDEDVIPDDTFDVDQDTFTDEPTPDLDLINRVLDGDDNEEAIVDMGSYEFRHPDVCSCADVCLPDLTGDCVVGVVDLLAFLAAWGPCADCGNCPADFDGNCTVGVPDLLIFLAAWGNCPCDTGPPPPSLADELADACLTQDDWDEYEDVMTDPESSEEDKDRYDCWMTHYIEHCDKCTCQDIPTCPSPDPFN